MAESLMNSVLPSTANSFEPPHPEVERIDEMNSPQPTVLRLKRRVEDSPSQVLVMSYKRRKNNMGGFDIGSIDDAVEDNICRNVFRLAGTVNANKDDSEVADTIKKALQNIDLSKPSSVSGLNKENLKRRSVQLNAKAKNLVQKTSSENRFRIVSNKRGLDKDDNNRTSSDDAATSTFNLEKENLFNLLDLVSEDYEHQAKLPRTDPREAGSITCNGMPMKKQIFETSPKSSNNADSKVDSDVSSKFVFDLYVSSQGIAQDQIHNQFVSVSYEDQDLDIDTYRGADSDDNAQDEDDSNDEDNFRNDYPDTEPESEDDTGRFQGYYDDGDDNDVMARFGKVVTINGDDLSSDDEEEDKIYSIENDGADDVGMMDNSYKRYKDRVRKEFLADEVVSSPSESD